MNSKKLKLLRKTIRSQFPAWPARQTTEGPKGVVRMEAPMLGLDGLPKIVPFEITGTVRNVAQTQRGLYRACKRSAALMAA